MRIQTVMYEGVLKKRVVYEITSYDLPGILGWCWDGVEMCDLLKDLEKKRNVVVVATKNSWLGIAGQAYTLSKVGHLTEPVESVSGTLPTTCKKKTFVFDVPNNELELISYSKRKKQYIAQIVAAHDLPKFLNRATEGSVLLKILFQNLKDCGTGSVLNSRGRVYDVRLASKD